MGLSKVVGGAHSKMLSPTVCLPVVLVRRGFGCACLLADAQGAVAVDPL